MPQAGRWILIILLPLATAASGCGGDSSESGPQIQLLELPAVHPSDDGAPPARAADTRDTGAASAADPGAGEDTPDTVDASLDVLDRPADVPEPPADAAEPPDDTAEPTTDTTEPSADTTDVPADTTEPPADTTDVPADTTEPPTDATDVPADTTEPPADTTEPPADTSDVPADSTEPPADTADVPADTTEPPADAADVPADTPEPEKDTAGADTDPGQPDAGPASGPGHWRCAERDGAGTCEAVFESDNCGDGACRPAEGESPSSCPADCAGDPAGPPCADAADCIFYDWPHAGTGFWACESPGPGQQTLCVAYASTVYCGTYGYDWCAEEWGESPANCPTDCAPGEGGACEAALDCVFEEWPSEND